MPKMIGADPSLIVEEATEQAMSASIDSGRVEAITDERLRAALTSVRPSIGPWLETVRNHVVDSNRGGEYDELEAFLCRNDAR